MLCFICGLLAIVAAVAAYFGFFRLLASLRLPLKGRAVLITGCDTGFGRLTTLRLKEQGAIVFAGCLTQKGVDELSKEGDNVRPFLLDVAKEESVDEAYEHVRKSLPAEGLWCLINNAGVLRGGPIDCQRLADIRLQLDVNVIGGMLMAKKFVHLLRKASGRLINIASVAGRVGFPNSSAYVASKFAVEGMSDSWRRELAPWGVKVIIVEPGFMKTNLWDRPLDSAIAQKSWDELPQQQKDFYGREYFNETLQAAQKMVEKLGGDPMQVVDALEAATAARFPQHRYLAGQDTYLWYFLATVPSGVSDIVFGGMQKHFPQALKK